jgi:hypothetical protein
MRKICSLREVVRSAASSHDGWELCATADAKYDRDSSTVLVELDSLVQPAHLPRGLNGFRQPWLPGKELVKQRVPLHEARAVARKVFRRWTTKVRRSVPARAQHAAD